VIENEFQTMRFSARHRHTDYASQQRQPIPSRFAAA